jgi:prepilin-type N-terminal cleavage/methylation domain-containing protein
MKAKSKQSGVTLTEMTVVVAVVALLAGLGMPAINAFFESFESEGSVRPLISAALATARAIAAKEQHYAGVRFQKVGDPEDPLEADQYMIFIMHDYDNTTYSSGFRAVEGIEPIKLPDSVGVMDLYTNGVPIADNDGIDEDNELIDTTTFSIVFSPAGKLVTHEVRASAQSYGDTVFNDLSSPDAMFREDSGDAAFPYWQEWSRNGFVIYDRKEFKQAYKNRLGYSDYLVKLVPNRIYVSPYTGTLISAD